MLHLECENRDLVSIIILKNKNKKYSIYFMKYLMIGIVVITSTLH